MCGVVAVDPGRRRFLSRFAGVAAGGSVLALTTMQPGVATTAPAPAAAIPQEDPALIALGERIEPALVEYRARAERHRSARALAESLVPQVPPEMIPEHSVTWLGYRNFQCDVEGKTLYHEKRIIEASLLEDAIEDGSLYAPKRTKAGKKVHSLIKTAREYEAARETAIERSGVQDAAAERDNSAFELERIARAVVDIDPLTMAGVLIQARALSAYAEAEIGPFHYRGKSGQIVGFALAQSLTRLSIA